MSTSIGQRRRGLFEGVARGLERYAHRRVAPRVPSAMAFVFCEDGVGHAPQARADTRDAALSAGSMLDTVLASVR